MPTYDYRCLKCGKVFEAFQKMSDAPLGECIYCKGKVERLISSGSGIIFKGSGFYETDYKQKNRKAAANDDKGCKGCPDNKCDLKKGK